MYSPLIFLGRFGLSYKFLGPDLQILGSQFGSIHFFSGKAECLSWRFDRKRWISEHNSSSAKRSPLYASRMITPASFLENYVDEGVLKLKLSLG